MPPSAADAQIILLYGDDVHAIAEAAAKLEAAGGDPTLADLNLSRFDLENRAITEDQIQAAAYALPFLTENRLVILRNPFVRFNRPEACQRLIRLLEGLPPTTRLALIVPDTHQGSSKGWEIMDDNKRGKLLLDWARTAGNRVIVRELRLPRQSEMANWILQRAKQEGGQFTPRAAAELAALTGNDTGIAAQEIRKLLTYVDYKRAVEVDDVQEVAASGGLADVFKMVDAIAMGENRTALRHLKILLEEEDPARLFGMIIRQYRLLILFREALEQGITNPAENAKRLKLHAFAAENLTRQAQRLSLTKLESAYRLILATDQMIKLGQADLETALQTLVVQLSTYQTVAT